MGKTEIELNALKKYLSRLPAGKVEEQHRNKIKLTLFKCWENLKGSDFTSMRADKLHRIENISWHPPNKIQFDIERHGATVNFSVYAHVYRWIVDLENGSAECDYPKQRLVGKKSPILKTKPLAQKIAQEILNEDKNSDNLEWITGKKVRVLISEIVPETNKATTAYRRKNFRKHLEDQLLSEGWQKTRKYYTYEKV